jgi:hypothetical protein
MYSHHTPPASPRIARARLSAGNFWLAAAIANAVWLLGDAIGRTPPPAI